MNLADKKTEKILRATQKNLKAVYKDAYKTINGRFRDFTSKYNKEYDKLTKRLSKGEISKSEYKAEIRELIFKKQWYADLKKEITNICVEHNAVACDIINRSLHEVFEINANYTAYELEKLYAGTSFSLVPKATIKELVSGNNHVTFRTVLHNPIKDYLWNERRITDTLTQGLILGEPIPQIADRFMEIMGNNYNAAVRNARTAVTSAQNAGKQNTFDTAVDMGIELEKEWVATSDGVTRDSHSELDGVRVSYNGIFPNGLMYPGDPSGDPGEVYNCRCTMRAILPDINDERRTPNDVDSYNAWLEEKRASEWL